MPVAFQPGPWSGTPSSVWASQGAAVPVMSGSGFNWASIVGSKVGGPVSAYTATVRGVPMTVSFVRRFGGLSGFRGLGQDTTTIDPTQLGFPTDYSLPSTIDVSNLPTNTTIAYPGIDTSGTASTTSSGLPTWAQQVIANVTGTGLKIASQQSSYANPLLGKSTYYQTPSGTVYASNQPTTGPSIFGTGTTGTSMLPILLIAGAVLLVIVMMGKR